MTFAVVVLAGQRSAEHPVARAAGVQIAVLAPLDGEPMLARVLTTLRDTAGVGSGVIVGDEEALASAPAVRLAASAAAMQWLTPAAGPSESALHGIHHLQRWPVLITTADHPLLTVPGIADFCAKALASGCDAVAGLARHQDVMAVAPGTRRTRIKFADDAMCGCNLFAILNERGLGVVRLWRQIEMQRKQPWKVMRLLGLPALLKYLTGRLTRDAAFARLSQLAGCRVGAVLVNDPTLAIDVDSEGDWRLAAHILAQRTLAERRL